MGVHGLGKAIGIEQEGVARLELGVLTLILPVVHHCQWQIGLHVELEHFIGSHDGGVVASVAVVQATSGQVEHTDEEGDKHARLIALAHRMVNHLHDAGGITLAGTNGTEQRVSHRHHQRRGHALAAGIANAEEELVVAQEEVVDVASHLAGGNQSAGNVDIAMAQVLVGQHVALDALGHLELTVDAHALVLVFY